MPELEKIPQYDESYYAVVDLGSNSFHLLITQFIHGKLSIVNKVKQKVRLASGLDSDNKLDDASIKRGLSCLSLFAKHLNTIPLQQISIVATATLRLATNRQQFLDQANLILPKKIKLLSGEEEANTIYHGATLGVAKNIPQQCLVIDIGGASTEIIIGKGETSLKTISLNIGCVSFTKAYFADGQLSKSHFEQAILKATEIITPEAKTFTQLGWQSAIGNSGTLQAIAEILRFNQKEEIITLEYLLQMQQTLIAFKTIDNIFFEGLRVDRGAVLASGLSILIALFRCLSIQALTLSTGAIREGLLFDMIPELITSD